MSERKCLVKFAALAIIIAGVIAVIIGVIVIILAIFAFRGRKIAYVALTITILFLFILSIINLIWRFDESVENIWGLVRKTAS